MLAHLQYPLLADGSSDACLIRVINWYFAKHLGGIVRTVSGQPADFRFLREPPRVLSERIRRALALYPCDLLVIHRDAENQRMEQRIEEIQQACSQEAECHVPLVPVRMTEAWLLIDEQALRRAAGNPNGKMDIALPRPERIEHIPDPKTMLRNLLLRASGKQGRNRQKFEARLPQRIHRVADLTEDFSALENLAAFQEFARRLFAAVNTLATQ